MIQVSIASGPRLHFPTGTGWNFTDDGTVVIFGPGEEQNLSRRLAEIPVQNVCFVEHVEEENADA